MHFKVWEKLKQRKYKHKKEINKKDKSKYELNRHWKQNTNDQWKGNIVALNYANLETCQNVIKKIEKLNRSKICYMNSVI